MARAWKVGELAWLNEYDGREHFKPVRVRIESLSAGGVHFIKAVAADGSVYYCQPSDLKTRQAKAVRSGRTAITQEQKHEAKALAERRMEELMEEKKNKDREQFETIRKGLSQLDEIEHEVGGLPIWEEVRKLAELGLFVKAYGYE